MIIRDNEDEQYYVDGGEDNRSINQEMDAVYDQGITLNQSYWSEADIDTRFKAGDQTLWNDIYGNLPAFRKKQFNFNRIRRVCNLITGYQRRNRKSVVAIPIENSDSATSDIYSKTLWWAWKRANCDEVVSRCFDSGAVTTGMALAEVWMDYNSDPVSGDIHCDYVPYNSFLIDPYFTKQDLSDCSYIWRRKWLTKMELRAIFPGRSDEIDKLKSMGSTDGKFQFMAESYQYSRRQAHIYDEYWHRTLREQTILVDLETGEAVEWKGKQEVLDQFLLMHPQIVVRTGVVPTVMLAQRVDGRIFYHGPNPMGIDQYPFSPFIGYYEPEMPYFPWRVQGVVRGLRDAQYLYNRRKIVELDILESQVTSGYKYKIDSLVNPKDIYLSGQGRGIALKKSADMTDVEKIMPPDIPPSMIQLSQILGQEVQEISGVNEELLGSATDEKAGILSMLRQGAGLTTLQILFDQLDNSTKLLGKLFLGIIQENFSPGKVKRITGTDPTPQFYQQAFGKYDVDVEEGLNTTTQRQMHFAQLLQLREMGIPVPGTVLLEASTLQNKDELVKAIGQAEQQQAQMQQAQAQAQTELLEAQKKALEAQAEANEGLGIERLSRVQENRAMAIERISQGIENRQLGTLNLTKAMKELEDMDISQIEKLINIIFEIRKISMQQGAVSDTIKSENLKEPAV